MSKMRLSFQLTTMTRGQPSPECKMALFCVGNCLALTAVLATATNCSSTDGDADATATESSVAALLKSFDKNANNPAMVVEDSIHAFNWVPAPVYGGGVSTQGNLNMFAVGDPNAAVTVSNNQCNAVGTGGWKSVSNTNDQTTACSAQAQAEATRIAAAEGDAPAACFIGTGTVETVNCGKQHVCTTTYGGGTNCSDVPVSMSTCHIKVTRAANAHYNTPFVPIGLEYEFPGEGNSLVYTKSITQSVAWSFTNSGRKSVKANILGEILGLSGGGSYSFSTTDSGTQSIKVSDGTTRTGSDPFQNHNGDTFSLWINPAVNYWTQCSDGDHTVYGLSTDPTTPTLTDPMAISLMDALDQDYREVGVWDIDAGSLLHPETLPDTRLVNFVKSLSASQIDQLLKMDPFYDCTTKSMMPSASLSSGRFVDIPGSSALYCPRNFSIAKGDTRVCKFDYSTSQVHIDSQSASYNFDLGLNSPLGGLSVELTAGYSGTLTTSFSSEVLFQYTIAGPASGQIAIDTLFSNYVLDMTL